MTKVAKIAFVLHFAIPGLVLIVGFKQQHDDEHIIPEAEAAVLLTQLVL